jgi:DNA polymerase I
MAKLQFYPTDITYNIDDGVAKIGLFGRTPTGETIALIDPNFRPYFWLELKDSKKLKDAKSDLMHLNVEGAELTGIEIASSKVCGMERELLKVYTRLPAQVPIAAKFFQHLELVSAAYEYDIRFVLRYLIDNKITPFVLTDVEGEFEDKKKTRFIVNKIWQDSDSTMTELKVLALDIETYNPSGKIFAPEKDPIIMLGLYGKDFKKVITWKKFPHKEKYIMHVDSEKELLLEFMSAVKEYEPDVIVGYNSDNFDLPYISTRADVCGVDLHLGINHNPIKIDSHDGAKIIGLPHIDVLNFIRRIMGRTLKSDFFTLDDISNELLGEGKMDVEISALFKAWETGKGLDKFCEYNLKDAELTYRLFNKVYPNMLELIRIVGLPIYELSRASHSQLVENYILKQTAEYHEIAPSRPAYQERETRSMSTYQGGSVFQPTPGLYSDVVVVDFRSFWPSLIVSHNIGPSTLNCKCCPKSRYSIEIGKERFHYCEKTRGFVPEILKKLITKRAVVKRQLRENKKDVLLSARSQALKDLSNAFYGYLGFPAARWYNVSCAKSITAFGRRYIQEVMDKAVKQKFKVLYSDTDSVFLALNNHNIEDVKQFVADINKSMPEDMELEVDEYYPAALFVSTKSDGGGAKKRYALLTKDNEIKIKGFESVRRNISPIAKEVQQKVLSLILIEKNPKKALIYLKEVLDKLRKSKIPLEKLTITTSLQKSVVDYTAMAPHVAVAKRLMEQGYEVGQGTVIQFVIAKGKGKINERAKLLTEISEGDYDPEYYINNQVIPAVDRIFEALGYSLEQLLAEKSQSNLQTFFK